MGSRRIAVVGGGISGLGAAWLLSQAHDVTLLERERRLGGHSNTIVVDAPEGPCPIDTGFIVYNTGSYPNLIALLRHLGVETARSNMSFAVSLDVGRYEYSGTGAHGLFGQPANLLSRDHWRMAADVLRFFREARALELSDLAPEMTLGQLLRERGYSEAFVRLHLLPMGAAIWSTPAEAMLAFPAAAFIRFFANHGLLQVRNRPEWRTVVHGSQAYVGPLAAAIRGRVETSAVVVGIVRDADGVLVTLADGRGLRFDAVVVACHGDEALRLIGDADGREREALSAFRYSRNIAVLHTDPGMMPRRRRLWSSWNYTGGGDEACVCVTYWMNRLQPLATGRNYFVTLNPTRQIAEEHVVERFVYEHPMFDAAAIAAQRRLWSLQGRGGLWLCGSYFGYGFHEDGLQSGLAVAEAIGGVRRPWSVAKGSSRIILSAESQPRAHRVSA